jgi:hypothetical protein
MVTITFIKGLNVVMEVNEVVIYFSTALIYS